MRETTGVADIDTVRRLALALPEVEEGTWFRTPAWKVRSKSFARIKEDGETLVVMVDEGEKEMLMEAEPEVFFQTPHYEGYPAMLVRLANIDEDELAEVLEDSWRRKAPKRLVRARDEARSAR
jgi:hypothetical protein